MNNKRIELLSEEELNSIKKELRSANYTGIISLLMLFVLVHLLIFINTQKWIIPNYELLVDLGLSLIIFVLTKYLTKDLRKEIELGTKIIENKLIENKVEYVDKQDRFSSEYTKYEIVAEGDKFIVNKDEYQKAELNDNLAIHKTSIREKIIRTEIININYP